MREMRGFVTGTIVGAMVIGAATAGIGARDAGIRDTPETIRGAAPRVTVAGNADADEPGGERLPDGTFLVGAAKVSIAPDPGRWTPDLPEGTCTDQDPGEGCLMTFDSRWAKSVREHGVWARAISISNGADTVVLAVLDTVGWFAYYPADVCGDCGSVAIRRAVGEELGIPADNIVLASTHTHASANTLADIPTWYYEQVRDAAKAAMRDAFGSMELGSIQVGSTASRFNNADRRIVTRAVPDYEVQWLRGARGDGSTIATLYNYAAHPTVLTSNDTLHSGYPGAANAALEDELGGTAMFFASGLGNQTVKRSRGIAGLGNELARVIIRDMDESARVLTSNEIAADVREIAIPGDNAVLLGARAASIFVRDVLPPAGGGPAAGRWGKNETMPACVGGGFLTVNTTVGGFRVGQAAIMLAPGEIFSTISLVTKDYLEGAEVAFVLALANDQLGYLIPYEEFDETAHQGPGLAANSTDTSQYEEVLSLGRCAGEQVMDELIASGRVLGFIPAN